MILEKTTNSPAFKYVVYTLVGIKFYKDYKNNNKKSLVIFIMTTITMMNVRKNLPLALIIGLIVSMFTTKDGYILENSSNTAGKCWAIEKDYEIICENKNYTKTQCEGLKDSNGNNKCEWDDEDDDEDDEEDCSSVSGNVKKKCLKDHINLVLDPNNKYYRYVGGKPSYGAGPLKTLDGKITHFQNMINAFNTAETEGNEAGKYCAGMTDNKHKILCLKNHIDNNLDPNDKYYRHVGGKPRYGAGPLKTLDGKITHFQNMITAFNIAKATNNEAGKYCAGMTDNQVKVACLEDKQEDIESAVCDTRCPPKCAQCEEKCDDLESPECKKCATDNGCDNCLNCHRVVQKCKNQCSKNNCYTKCNNVCVDNPESEDCINCADANECGACLSCLNEEEAEKDPNNKCFAKEKDDESFCENQSHTQENCPKDKCWWKMPCRSSTIVKTCDKYESGTTQYVSGTTELLIKTAFENETTKTTTIPGIHDLLFLIYLAEPDTCSDAYNGRDSFMDTFNYCLSEIGSGTDIWNKLNCREKAIFIKLKAMESNGDELEQNSKQFSISFDSTIKDLKNSRTYLGAFMGVQGSHVKDILNLFKKKLNNYLVNYIPYLIDKSKELPNNLQPCNDAYLNTSNIIQQVVRKMICCNDIVEYISPEEEAANEIRQEERSAYLEKKQQATLLRMKGNKAQRDGLYSSDASKRKRAAQEAEEAEESARKEQIRIDGLSAIENKLENDNREHCKAIKKEWTGTNASDSGSWVWADAPVIGPAGYKKGSVCNAKNVSGTKNLYYFAKECKKTGDKTKFKINLLTGEKIFEKTTTDKSDCSKRDDLDGNVGDWHKKGNEIKIGDECKTDSSVLKCNTSGKWEYIVSI